MNCFEVILLFYNQSAWWIMYNVCAQHFIMIELIEMEWIGLYRTVSTYARVRFSSGARRVSPYGTIKLRWVAQSELFVGMWNIFIALQSNKVLLFFFGQRKKSHLCTLGWIENFFMSKKKDRLGPKSFKRSKWMSTFKG